LSNEDNGVNLRSSMFLILTRLSCQIRASTSVRLRTMALHSTPDKIQVIPHRQYITPESLTPSDVSPSPLDQFRAWFTEIQGSVQDPEAMTLSTATASGIPSSRVVLFKQLDSTGFVFYTNYTSRKSKELLQNPHASLVFYWKEINRQVRVLGTVEKVSREESEEYFHSRPIGSQLGAWASKQSSVIGEGEIEERLAKYKHMFSVDSEGDNASIPLPEFWGGWRVIPKEVEFWLGKPSRLHDRVRYLRVEGSSEWQIDRLSP